MVSKDRRDIGEGWYVEYNSDSALRHLDLVYDRPGSPAQYHGGQQSFWILNAVDKKAFYADGDPYRKPNVHTIGRASAAAKQLDQEGLLWMPPAGRKNVVNTPIKDDLFGY